MPVEKVQEHVYYGYVPISTDMVPLYELENGVTCNVSVPSGHAILDIIGFNDETYVKIINIVTGEELESLVINDLEHYRLFVPYGTFFKVISSSRVGVFLCGGNGYGNIGASVFYPATAGGFIGTEYKFISGTITDSYEYMRAGVNLYIEALEKTDFSLYDSTGVLLVSESIDQHGTKKYQLECRRTSGSPVRGGGNSIIFHLKTNGLILASSMTSHTFTAVPALTGGFVGKIFYTPVFLAYEEPGAVAALIITPIEPSKVTIYDENLNVMAERSFSENDVENNVFWFYSVGRVIRRSVLIVSTGNITVMTGSTRLYSELEYFGDDITFLGAKGNQEIKFYAPTQAIIFAPSDVSAVINGRTVFLKKDSFVILESGVNSVKADGDIIIQVLGMSSGWLDWGSYLIEPLDIETIVEVPKGFGEKTFSLLDFLTGNLPILGIVVFIIVLMAFYIRRRSKSGHKGVASTRSNLVHHLN
jgi:hypothetical protein